MISLRWSLRVRQLSPRGGEPQALRPRLQGLLIRRRLRRVRGALCDEKILVYCETPLFGDKMRVCSLFPKCREAKVKESSRWGGGIMPQVPASLAAAGDE